MDMKKGGMLIGGCLLLFSLLSINIASAYSSYYSYSNTSSMIPLIIFLIIYLIIFIVWILVAVWVYKDAKKRKENAGLWAVIVIFAGLIGVLIWFAMRPPIGGRKSMPDRICPNCGRAIPTDAVVCPYCSKRFDTYL
ncbi:MAG: hypothetical protein V1726_07715 [Methanobacteriota archaeon]